mmetsp:Transcript_51098/g.119651  ORF Transcript_51098/g.119651 Transcript_51098/m.119651 type:complete len:118 (+) Transcript_51098:1605-1958(+)
MCTGLAEQDGLAQRAEPSRSSQSRMLVHQNLWSFWKEPSSRCLPHCGTLPARRVAREEKAEVAEKEREREKEKARAKVKEKAREKASRMDDIEADKVKAKLLPIRGNAAPSPHSRVE